MPRTDASDNPEGSVKEGGDAAAAERMDPKAQDDTSCERTQDAEEDVDVLAAVVEKSELLKVGFVGEHICCFTCCSIWW